MKQEEIDFLIQLISSIEEANSNLEGFYKSRDYERFAQAKKFILGGQKKILGILK